MRFNIAQGQDNRDCDSSSMESGSPKKRVTIKRVNPKVEFSSDLDTQQRKLRPRRNEKLSEAFIQKPGDIDDIGNANDFGNKLKVIIEPEDFASSGFGKSNKVQSDENVLILKRMMDHIVSVMSDDEHKPLLEKMFGESEILEVKNLIKSGENDREKVYQILKPSTLKIYENLNQPEHMGLFKGSDVFSLISSPTQSEEVNQIVADFLQTCGPANKCNFETVKKDKLIKRLFNKNIRPNLTDEVEINTEIEINETYDNEIGSRTRSNDKTKKQKMSKGKKKSKKIIKSQLLIDSPPEIQDIVEPDVIESTELTDNNENSILKQENINVAVEHEKNFMIQNLNIGSPKIYLNQNKMGIRKLIGCKDFVQEVIGNVVICGETEIDHNSHSVVLNDSIELEHQMKENRVNSFISKKDFENDSSIHERKLKSERSTPSTSKNFDCQSIEIIEISDDESSDEEKVPAIFTNTKIEDYENLASQVVPLYGEAEKQTDQTQLSVSKESNHSHFDFVNIINSGTETNFSQKSPSKQCTKQAEQIEEEDSSSSSSSSSNEDLAKEMDTSNFEVLSEKDIECNETLQINTSDQLKQSVEEDNTIKCNNQNQEIIEPSNKETEVLIKELSPFMELYKEKKAKVNKPKTEVNKQKREVKKKKVTEGSKSLLNDKQVNTDHKPGKESNKKDETKERKKRGRTISKKSEVTKRTPKKKAEIADITNKSSNSENSSKNEKITSKVLSEENGGLDETLEQSTSDHSKTKTPSKRESLSKKESKKKVTKKKTPPKTTVPQQEEEQVPNQFPRYETDSDNELMFGKSDADLNLSNCSINFDYCDNFDINQNDYIAMDYDIDNNSDSSYEKMVKEINSAKLETMDNEKLENINDENDQPTFQNPRGSKMNEYGQFTKGQKELDHFDHLEHEMDTPEIVENEDDYDDDILDLVAPNLDNMFNENETNTGNAKSNTAFFNEYKSKQNHLSKNNFNKNCQGKPHMQYISESASNDKNLLAFHECRSLMMVQEGSREKSQHLASPLKRTLNPKINASCSKRRKHDSEFNDFHPLPLNNCLVKSSQVQNNSNHLHNCHTNSYLQIPKRKMLRRENLRREKTRETKLLDHCRKSCIHSNTKSRVIESQESTSNIRNSGNCLKKGIVRSPTVLFLPNFPEQKDLDNSEYNFSNCSSPSISCEDFKTNTYCENDSYSYDCDLEVEKEDTLVFINNEIPVKTTYINNEPIGIMCSTMDEDPFISYREKYQLQYAPEQFVAKLREKVQEQKDVLKNPFMDNVVKKFMTKICEEYFTNGSCCSDQCPKRHLLPKEWYNMMADKEAWTITNLILKDAIQPPVPFCVSVMKWLGEVRKNKVQIILVTEYFTRIKTYDIGRTVWMAVLKALMICGFQEWEAVCCVLLYFYNKRTPSITRNIMRFLGLEKRMFPNMWRSLQPLAEIGFQLPNTIIRSLLELLCYDKNNFNSDAILLIGLQVKQMKPMNLQRMDTLIQKFLEIHKTFFPAKTTLKSCLKDTNKTVKEESSRKRTETFSTEDLPVIKKPLISNTANTTSPSFKGVYEVEKVKAALLRAVKAKNNSDIANILLKYGIKKEFEEILAQELFTLLQNENNIYQMIKDLFHEIRLSSNCKHSILIMARVCITLMLHFVINYSNWKSAFDFLLLIRENHLNPIIIKPVCYEYSELRIAITCSEINFYNNHFNSAIGILINNNLLYKDSSKWHINGTIREFHFVIQLIQFLFINFNSSKMVDVAYTLFKSTMNAQNNLHLPIDLLDFYEPLLCNMFEKFDKYKHKLLSFYLQVNEMDSSVQLTGLSYRVLIIVAVRNDNFEVIKDLVSKAIGTYVYPILQEKDNVIMLNTCLLQEEIKAYLVEWFRWDMIKNKDRSTQKYNIQIQFKISTTEDFIECKQLPVPMILNSVDPSLNCAVRRLQTVISEFVNIPFQSLNIKMKNDALYVPPETTKLLMKSAKKMC